MPGLDDNIDFSALSDADLQKLLDEERAKRASFVPQKKGKIASGTATTAKRGRPAKVVEEIEVDLD